MSEQKEYTLKNIRESALKFLAIREHTTKELTQKLKAKHFDPIQIQSIVATLEKEGLLSNTRFIESFIHYRRNKGYGPMYIKAELIHRGITEELIEQQLDISDNTWFSEAIRVWKKRFKSIVPADYKARAQQMRFLQYRGFTKDQIKSVFETL